MPFATLPSKPQAPLAYEFFDNGSDLVVVFINGLGLPSMSWNPVVNLLQKGSPVANYLLYDRYGQGATLVSDPVDDLPGKDPGYGHDLDDVVTDLHELLQVVTPRTSRLAFISASIGVHVARLYAHKYSGVVEGHVMLDSNVGTVDFAEMWPDPRTDAFDPKDVESADCTLEQYKVAFENMNSRFGSAVKNREGLDRRNVKRLLPDPASPKLVAPDGKGPFLIVVGHDPDQFAEESVNLIQVPRSLTYRFTQPVWTKYNEELLKLSDPARTSGVVIAPGCGHFIQRDNPGFVAGQVENMLVNIRRNFTD